MPVTAVELKSTVYDYDAGTYVSVSYDHLLTIRLGANVTEIEADGLKSLTSVDFGGSAVTSVSMKNCTALTSVDIPATVTKLDHEAFRGCTSLASVTFHEGLEEIVEYAFVDTVLTEVWLPASLTRLQPNAFDPDVILHFTGDAGSVQYSYVDNNNNVVFSSVLPVLMQEGFTIAQFYGEGLEEQDGYYVPASSVTGESAAGNGNRSEEAGSPVSGGMQTEISENGNASPAAAGEAPSADAAADETANQAEDPASDSPLTGPQAEADTGNPDEQAAGASEDATVFEVIQDTVQNNPWVIVLLAAALAALIAVGGWSRYRRSRQ